MAEFPKATPKNPRRALKSRLQEEIKFRRVCALVVNTRSRQGETLYHRAKALLLRHGFSLGADYAISDPSRLLETVANVIAEGHRLVIVGGGDGTISSVVDLFAYRNVVFGLLPLGTANSFARTLSIPLGVEGAVEVIVNGKVADIDLGKINDDYFANSAAIGLAPTVARSIPLWMKRYLGIAGYGLVAATKFVDHQPFRCELHEEGGDLTVDDALEVIIANGKYHGGVLVAEDADPESFELVVRIVKGPSKLNLLLAWLLPGSSGHDVVLKVRVQKGSLTTDPWQYVSLDGEVVMRTPLKLAVAVEALLMMVPPSFEDRDLPNDFEPAT